MSPLALHLLVLAARMLGRLSAREFAAVLEWIEDAADRNPGSPGWQKLDQVLDRWKAFFGDTRPGHVARTVVEIAHAVLKAKGTL